MNWKPQQGTGRAFHSAGLLLGTLASVLAGAGCDEGDQPGPARLLEAKATLQGTRLKIEGRSDQPLRALGQTASYYGGDPEQSLRIATDKLSPGQSEVEVSAGTSSIKVPIEAPLGLLRSKRAAKAALKGRKPALTVSIEGVGEAQVQYGSFWRNGFILQNLRGGTVFGETLRAGNNLAYLPVDPLQVLRDQRMDDLFAEEGGPLRTSFDIEVVHWDGKRRTHEVAVSWVRRSAATTLRERLEKLAKEGKALAEWKSTGRGVYAGLRSIKHRARFTGPMEVVSDLRYLAMTDVVADTQRRAGTCGPYRGRGQVDVFVRDETLRIRPLTDPAPTAEKRFGGKRGRCPMTMNPDQKNFAFGGSPNAMLRWVDRKVRAMPQGS